MRKQVLGWEKRNDGIEEKKCFMVMDPHVMPVKMTPLHTHTHTHIEEVISTCMEKLVK